MSERFDREAMLQLPHADVRARYQAMFGEPPRSPNKVWMINQMEEHGARRAESEESRAASRGAPSRKRTTRLARGPATVADEAFDAATAAGAAPECEAAPSPEAEAPEEASLAGTAPDSATQELGRYRSMTVEDLRRLYEEKVGRTTQSVDQPYLIWKITQAEKGKIRLGRVAPGQRREGTLAGADKTLPLTLTAAAVAAVDGAWARTGFPNRMSFMRTAIREALLRRGESDAAAHFPEKGVAEA